MTRRPTAPHVAQLQAGLFDRVTAWMVAQERAHEHRRAAVAASQPRGTEPL